MLTTARKIEIATAVIEDSFLGSGCLMFTRFVPYGICGCVFDYCDNSKETRQFIEHIGVFARSINISTPESEFWFSSKESEARTERIEFLNKYIQHLKEQL